MKQVLMGNHLQMLYEVGDTVSVRVELLGQTAEWIGKVVNRHEAREPGVYDQRGEFERGKERQPTLVVVPEGTPIFPSHLRSNALRSLV